MLYGGLLAAEERFYEILATRSNTNCVSSSHLCAVILDLLHHQMKKRDWTRLFPRPKDSTDSERICYLVEFIIHNRGSHIAKDKAAKELVNIRNEASQQ